MALLQCMSHSPLMELNAVPGAQRAAVDQAISRARAAISAYAPDLTVIFFPDHYNGFTYGLMPPYCIGAAAQTIGDYGTEVFTVNVPGRLAYGCVEALLAQGFDPAISYDMKIDHGGAQPLSLLLEDHGNAPVLPIFVNAAGVPLGPVLRAWHFGRAVGDYLRSLERKVLIIGSGGLSHDPPIPRITDATAEQRRHLISGNLARSADEERRRQERIADYGKKFAEMGAATLGIHELNPAWDNAFLDIMERADPAALAAMNNEDMEQAAGNAVQEVRSWVAAFGALSAFGSYDTEDRFYECIPQWIAGFGMLRARAG